MINKVVYKDFCQHKDLTLEFSPGINVILGANKLGKTNILEGISYGVFGKTNHSKLDKIINYDAKSAVIELKHSKFKTKRTRNSVTSKLEHTTANELSTLLNFNYEEYLRLFYISRQESTKLFDASYFKQFLMSLFNLDKYSKIYDRLRVELDTLNRVDREVKKVNKETLTARLNRVSAVVLKYKQQRVQLENESRKHQAYKEKVNIARGKLESIKSEFRKKAGRVKWDKCYTCDRPITQVEKQALMTELRKQKPLIEQKAQVIAKAYANVAKVLDKFNLKIGVLDNRISKGRILFARIKEKLQEKAKPNLARIKELNTLIPIFSNNGFPAYLLQTYTPIVQETANSLLNLVFTDLSIKIRNHRPNSNIPDFKIMIYRNGQEVGTLNDVSGAESFLVNLCLRLGIIVIFKQLNNTCIDWIALDESMDKLDDDNSIRILSLLKNFMRIGYIQQVFLVSHKESLKNLEGVNYVRL